MNRPSGKRLAVILTIGAAAYLVGSMYQPTVVVGDSMAPTLSDGRVIYVDRTYYQSHPPRAGGLETWDGVPIRFGRSPTALTSEEAP